jgi:exportin-7
MFAQMLSTVLNIIMFEDCRNQWSMSRPLLGLILLNEEVCVVNYYGFSLLSLFHSLQYFNKLRSSIITSQPSEKQAAMAQCFENLMEGIDRTLLTKNRDRYVFNALPHNSI